VYNGGVDWHDHNQTHQLDYPDVDHEPTEYSTHLFTRQAIRILQDWSSDPDDNHKKKPGFLHLTYTAPQDPLQAPDQYLENPSCRKMQDWRRRVYCGMVSAIDEGIGQIYQALQQHGLADNTIILFSTDNGGAPAAGGFNYPYRGQKATLYEGGFKTPAILHVPGAVRYSPLYQNTIHLADFAPTLLGIVDRTVGDTAGLGLYEELGQDIDGQDHTLWMFQSVGGGQSTTSVVQ
jgi:arylsulfatase A-like enzyme